MTGAEPATTAATMGRSLLLVLAALGLGVLLWAAFGSDRADEPALAGADPQAQASPPAEPRASDLRGAPAQATGRQEATSADPVLDDRPRGTLEGYVVDDLGAPVRVFEVWVRATAGDRGLNPDAPGPITERTLRFEDGTGHFAFEAQRGDSVLIEISAPGYASGTHAWEGAGLTEAGDPGFSSTPPARLTLRRRALLSGRVLTPKGEPAAGAHLDVEIDGVSGLRVACDEEGRFAVTAEGVLRVTPYHEDWIPGLPARFDLHRGLRSEGHDLRVRAGGDVRGLALDSDDQPLAGLVRIEYARGPGPEAEAEDRTTTDGSFAFGPLVPGLYGAIFEPADSDPEDFVEAMAQMVVAEFEIREGETTELVIGGRKPGAVRLHGTLRANGEPVAGGVVFALREGTATMASWRVGRTDASGSYELELEGPGSYIVAAGRDTSGDPPVERFVWVPDRRDHQLDLTFPGGGIRGVVRDPAGDPDPDAQVTATGTRPTMFTLDGGRDAAPDGAGRYAFEDLPPDTYTLRARLDGQVFAVRAGVVVREGEVVEGVDFVRSEPGQLTGIIRDASGDPVAGATVFARTAGGGVVAESSQVRSGPDGRFRAEGVPPGTLTVFARERGRASSESAPVEVRPGEAVEVELVLTPGTEVRVTTTGQGHPVSAALLVTDEAGRSWSNLRSWDDVERMRTEGYTTTTQTVGPLPPGRYTFEAVTPAGARARRVVTLQGEPELALELEL